MSNHERTAPIGAACAMMFSHPSDLSNAADMAKRYAGDRGRIATLPDLIDARLATGPEATPWLLDFTSNSAEYLGLSRTGVPLIVVAHGVGPLTDTEGSHVVYGPSASTGKEWRITWRSFRDMLEGRDGRVEIVELRAVLRLRRLAFGEMLTFDQACEDPLVRARLGQRAVPYLEKHLELSKRWLRDHDLETYGNNCVLSQRDASALSYAGTELDDDTAIGHPLALSTLIEYDHGHCVGPEQHVSLVTELHCHERGDRARFVGIRDKRSMLTSVRPDMSRVLARAK